MNNDAITLTLVASLLACVIVPWVRHEKKKQLLRKTTRSDEQVRGYYEFLTQSQDNELSLEDAEFVESLFSAALQGEYTMKHRPMERAMRRLRNRYQVRALGMELVERWRKTQGDEPDILKMPPDLRAIHDGERLWSKPLSQNPIKQETTQP